MQISTLLPLNHFEELYTNLLRGDNRRLDIAIEVKLKGQDTLIIVHIESQSRIKKILATVCIVTLAMLYNKYQKPILPIALFSYDDKHTE